MPFPMMKHQKSLYERTKKFKVFALFWEQGSGKSKAMVDEVMRLYEQGEINAFLIVAPPGCYEDWTKKGMSQKGHLEDHLTDEFKECVMMHTWISGKASNKASQRTCERLLNHDGLSILCMSYAGFYTKLGRAYAKKFLKKRKAFYGLDESRRIKRPRGKVSNLVVGSGDFAERKWIMTGTPVSNGPMDIWKQMRFLDKNFWDPYGFRTFSAFKHTFGVWQTGLSSGGKPFEYCVAYKNLPLLGEILAPFSDRVLTEHITELPPKNYRQHHFKLSRLQREIYDELEKEHIVFLKDGGLVTATMTLTRIIRTVQISSNYMPDDDTGELLTLDPNNNPRMDLFMDTIEDIPGKRIVWAEFNPDINQIMDRLGKCAVQFDGQITKSIRNENEERFLSDPDITTIVSKQSVGGEGKNWQHAPNMLYYNCRSDLDQRLQSERRNWRTGAKYHTFYHDFVAENTIDEKHVNDLTRKQRDSDVIMQDDQRRLDHGICSS